MFKIAEIIKNTFFIIAVVILIAAAICIIFNIRPLVVLSGSMEPEINTGSVALVNEKDKEVAKGDIIVFQAGDVMVTHRVIDISEEGCYITKGDNNEDADAGFVTEEMIVGTTFATIPYLGYFIKAISTTSGIIIITTICLVLILLSFMKKEEKNEKGKSGSNAPVD